MNGNEAQRLATNRTLQQMMLTAQRDKLEIMSPRDNPKIPFTMTEFDFRNTLLDFPMTISPDELALLVERYKEGRTINYARFVDDLLASANPPSPTRKIKNVNPKYAALAKHLYERNTNLISQIAFMDRQHNGKITAENFARALTDFPMAKDVARLAMDLRTREIDYLKLQKILDSVDVGAPKPKPKPATENLPSCFQKFAQLIHSRSIDITEYFLREHRTRTGTMPRDKFFNLLYQLNLQLPRNDMLEIVNYFSDDNDEVDYQKFVATVTAQKIEAAQPPPRQIDSDKLIHVVVDNFNDRKLNTMSLFKPLDENGDGRVSRTAFLKTLNSLNFDMDKGELQDAVDALTDQDTMTVNYVDFAKRVYNDRHIEVKDTIDSALQNLRDYIQTKNLMLHKYLGLYDRDKSGLITTNQFLSSIRKMGYDISDNDINLIKERFEDKKTRHHILWKELCKEVDDSYVQKISGTLVDNSNSWGLEKTTNDTVSDLLKSSPRQTPLYDTAKMSSTNQNDSRPVSDILIPLLARIYRAINEYGFNLEGELISQDKMKKGTITRTAFKETLDLLPLTIPPEQLDELIEFYSDENTRQIYYLTFTKDVNETGANYELPEEEKKVPVEEPKEENNSMTLDMRKYQSVDGLPASVEPLLVKILEYNHVHNVTTYEIFHPFDKRHNGLIEAAAVQRAFGPTGIHYTPNEYSLFVDSFRSDENRDFVNYMRICKAVDSLDKSKNQVGMIPISGAEEQEVWRIVNRIQTTLRNKRSNLRYLFSKETSDIIPSTKLFSVIENVGRVILNPNERRLVTKKYHVNTKGDIDLNRILDDSETTIRLI